ncbi:MAG: tetraacyldisaccharide 4'-kinase [Candidatus Eisenbacteria bacterium]
MMGRPEPIGGPLGALGEALYRTGLGLRNALYVAGLRWSARLPARVVGVGNLTAGGTGKTPVVAELAARFEGAGWRTAILSRGHGRDHPERIEVVPPGEEPPEGAHRLYGDEPCLLRGRLPETPIVLARDRTKGGRAAIERFGADLLLLDDGFQHRRLARDRDVVVLRGEAPFGDGRLLPRGLLREPPSGIGRAHLVLINRTGGEAEGLDDLLDRVGAPEERVRFEYEPDRLLDPSGEEVDLRHLRARPVVAVSGIGDPSSFEYLLAGTGALVSGAIRFADHHRFTPSDCSDIADEAARFRAVPVTTEKDRIRLAGRDVKAAGVYTLIVRIRWTGETDALDRLVSRP